MDDVQGVHVVEGRDNFAENTFGGGLLVDTCKNVKTCKLKSGSNHRIFVILNRIITLKKTRPYPSPVSSAINLPPLRIPSLNIISPPASESHEN